MSNVLQPVGRNLRQCRLTRGKFQDAALQFAHKEFMEVRHIKIGRREVEVPDSKNRENELGCKVFCPRCCCAVPAFVRTTRDLSGERKEIHCLKCRVKGHVGGTLIQELPRGE